MYKLLRVNGDMMRDELWHGFSNIGDTASRHLGKSHRRLVLWSTSWCIFKHVSPLCLAIFTLSSIYHLSSKFNLLLNNNINKLLTFFFFLSHCFSIFHQRCMYGFLIARVSSFYLELSSASIMRFIKSTIQVSASRNQIKTSASKSSKARKRETLVQKDVNNHKITIF